MTIPFPTLGEIDETLSEFDALLRVGNGTLPQRARLRQNALSQLRAYRDTAFAWASRKADRRREQKLAAANKTQSEILSLSRRLRDQYGQLGLDVEAEPDALIAAWPDASEAVERAIRDAKNLAPPVPGVGGIGDEVLPPSQPPIEVEVGRQLRDGLQDLKSLSLVLASQRNDAAQVDPRRIDEEHVRHLKEFAAIGMVPHGSDRPLLDSDLVNQLAEVGIDIVSGP